MHVRTYVHTYAHTYYIRMYLHKDRLKNMHMHYVYYNSIVVLFLCAYSTTTVLFSIDCMLVMQKKSTDSIGPPSLEQSECGIRSCIIIMLYICVLCTRPN